MSEMLRIADEEADASRSGYGRPPYGFTVCEGHTNTTRQEAYALPKYNRLYTNEQSFSHINTPISIPTHS